MKDDFINHVKPLLPSVDYCSFRFVSKYTNIISATRGVVEPIIISEVINVVANVKGVQSVQKIIIDNVSGTELGYSQYKYDFKIATNENIIFPSMDPCIFELKYPNNDIRGKITQY